MTLSAGDIIVKDEVVLKGVLDHNFDPLLTTIILSIAKKYGIFITESYRDKRHDNDLHGTDPVRAIDLRFWVYSTEKMAYDIAHWVNTTWVYDPFRIEMVVALIHDSGQGIHFHIQVGPNTKKR